MFRESPAWSGSGIAAAHRMARAVGGALHPKPDMMPRDTVTVMMTPVTEPATRTRVIPWLARGRGRGRPIKSPEVIIRSLLSREGRPLPAIGSSSSSHVLTSSAMAMAMSRDRYGRTRNGWKNQVNVGFLDGSRAPRGGGSRRGNGGKEVNDCSPVINNRRRIETSDRVLPICHVALWGSPSRPQTSGGRMFFFGGGFGRDRRERRPINNGWASVSESWGSGTRGPRDTWHEEPVRVAVKGSFRASVPASSSSSSTSTSESAMADELDLSSEEEALRRAIKRIESEEEHAPVQVDLRYQLAGMGSAFSQHGRVMPLFTRRCFEEWLHLCCALGKSNTVKALYLQGNNLGSSGNQVAGPLLRSLSEALAANTSLEVVNLSANGIGDQDAAVIAKALARHPSLKAIHLYANEIKDEGAEAIAGVLARGLPRSLEVLELSVNGIGDAGAIALASTVAASSRIRRPEPSESHAWLSGVGDQQGAGSLSCRIAADGNVNQHSGQARGDALWIYVCYNRIGRAGCRSLSASLPPRHMSEMMVEQRVESIPRMTEGGREQTLTSEDCRSERQENSMEIRGLIEGGVFLEGNPGFSAEEIVRDGVGYEISVEDAEKEGSRKMDEGNLLEVKATVFKKDLEGNSQGTKTRGVFGGDLDSLDFHSQRPLIAESFSMLDKMNEMAGALENDSKGGSLGGDAGELFWDRGIDDRRQRVSVAEGSKVHNETNSNKEDLGEESQSGQNYGNRYAKTGKLVSEGKQGTRHFLADTGTSYPSKPVRAEASSAGPLQSDLGVNEDSQLDSVTTTGTTHRSQSQFHGKKRREEAQLHDAVKGVTKNIDAERRGGFSKSVLEDNADSTPDSKTHQDRPLETSSAFVPTRESEASGGTNAADELEPEAPKNFRSPSLWLRGYESESRSPTSIESPGESSVPSESEASSQGSSVPSESEASSQASHASALASSSFPDAERQHKRSSLSTSPSHGSSLLSPSGSGSFVTTSGGDSNQTPEDVRLHKEWSPLQCMLPAEWRKLLIGTPGFDCLRHIDQLLEKERDNVLPQYNQIFRALEMCAPDAVRAVILGQDPYPRRGDADGLAFSKCKIEGSLENILEALENDLGHQEIAFRRPVTGSLTKWAQQGVLLLNTALTVSPGMSGSHLDEWRPFTTAVITALSDRQGPGIPFALWGRKAQAWENCIKEPPHIVLRAGHPSPLNFRQNFKDCRHFSKVNDFLRSQGVAPIDWLLV